MPTTSTPYRLIVRAAKTVVGLTARGHSKVARGHRGRLLAPTALKTWATHHRRTGTPLIWLHAPSVGEGLQAEAILHALRRGGYQGQVAYTYFSPSAEKLAARIEADVTAYLPYDLRADLDPVMHALSPDVVGFTKLDLWPEAACRAAAAGAEVMLLAATVRRGSSRLRWPARRLLRSGYASVSAAGAISPEDAERLARLGVDPSVITVTGDPRFDSVQSVVAATDPSDPLLALASGDSLVAGSTWPDDERVLLAAFSRVRSSFPSARLIVVPHEPDEGHLAGLERLATEHGLGPPVRLSELDALTPPLVVVDRVGALARIYGGGTVAYVGGGMGSIGLHSVLEPAAWGLPVIVGPQWDYSRDAGLLLAAGGAAALSSVKPVDDLVETWSGWLADRESLGLAGQRAREVVAAGSGAAARTASLVLQHLNGR